jgi:hypothetical protein
MEIERDRYRVIWRIYEIYLCVPMNNYTALFINISKVHICNAQCPISRLM